MMWIKLLQLLLKFKYCLMQQLLLAMGGSGSAPNPPVFDAATAVNANSTGGPPTSTITFAHTCTGTNRGLIVGFMWNVGAITSISATYAGVSMTLVGTKGDADDNIRVTQFKLSAPTSGANNVVLSFTGDVTSIVGAAVSFTNCHQTTASLTGTQAQANGTSGSPSVDVTSSSNEIVVDVICWLSDSGQTMSVGSGQTSRANALNGTEGGAVSTESGAGTVTMSWTPSAAITDWGSVGVSVKAP